MMVYVLLDDRDYYGPHFDDLFTDEAKMDEYIKKHYGEEWPQCVIHEFEVDV